MREKLSGATKYIASFFVFAKRRIRRCLINDYRLSWLAKVFGLALLGIVVFCVSNEYKKRSIRTTQQITEQSRILSELHRVHFDFAQKDNNTGGNIQQLFNQLMDARSFSSVVSLVGKRCGLAETKVKMYKPTIIKKGSKATVAAAGGGGAGRQQSAAQPHLTTPTLYSHRFSIKLYAENDKNIAEFMNELERAAPGIVLFSNVRIRRKRNILTKDKFYQMKKKRSSQGKPFIIFNATVSGVIITGQQVPICNYPQ
jgi:hypothetical protein